MSSSITPSLAAADLFTVNGLVAVITGGATGIGLMMAKALEQNGAKVYIVGRRKEVLEKVAKEASQHGNIIPLQGDASSKEDLTRLVAHITAEVGYINLLVANAGVGGPELSGPQILGPGMQLAALQKEMWDTDAAAFDNTFDVNVRGVYYTVTAFLPLLEAGNAKKNVEQSSQVVITSSIGGFHRVPFPHFAYCASKAAVTHMGKQMATAFHPYRIRVNILAPGMYPSEMTIDAINGMKAVMKPEEFTATIECLGRLGNIEDISGIILWLASKAGGWLTGNVVVTDGGRLSLQPATY